MSRAGGDVEERKRIEEENKVAKMITLQNLFAFCLVCGIIRAGELFSFNSTYFRNRI